MFLTLTLATQKMQYSRKSGSKEPAAIVREVMAAWTRIEAMVMERST